MSPQLLVPALAPAVAVAPALSRRYAAAVLQSASRVLARAAQRLAVPGVERELHQALPPQLEFHAEAGAPEGALYADGVLVAVLPGVNRL